MTARDIFQIGINYIGQRSELKGCANDARGMKEFIVREYPVDVAVEYSIAQYITEYYGFHASNVLLLTDDDRRNVLPTRREIFRALSWLIKGARKDDSLFFHCEPRFEPLFWHHLQPMSDHCHRH